MRTPRSAACLASSVVVVDPIPRDVQRHARRAPVNALHLGGVGDLLVRVARHARLGEHLEPGARVAERPRRQLDVQVADRSADPVGDRCSIVIAAPFDGRSREVEHLVERTHLLVGRRRRRSRSTGAISACQRSLTGSSCIAATASARRARRLEVAEQRAVVVEEQRVVVPAAPRAAPRASPATRARWWARYSSSSSRSHLEAEADPVAVKSAADVGLVVHGERAHHDAQARRRGSGPSRWCTRPSARR